MVPLASFGGMPGGMELAIIFLILLLLAVPLVLIVVALRYVSRDSGDADLEDRVETLEGDVAALREELRDRDE
jgi:membrane protein implicated in regulation of membrane protease activity